MRSETADEILEQIRRQITPYNLDIMGFHLQIEKEVYPPIGESILLAENLSSRECGIRENDRVLDYGCGSGFQSLVSASLGGSVVATDINVSATRCSHNNAKNNNLDGKIEVRQGKNLEPILPGEHFDVVIASLPFEDAQVFTELEYAVYDPNLQMRQALFGNILKHLTTHGRIFYTYSARVQKSSPLEQSSDRFLFNVIDQREIKGERYFLYLIRPK